MVEIQDEHLAFVAKHFDSEAFSTREGWGVISNRVQPPRRFWGYALALTGVLAALVLGVFFFKNNRYTHIDADESSISVILPDRTMATLAPGSSMSFHKRHFAHKNRNVLMKGKIFFNVERNEALPFVVSTADALITVVGTSFQIEKTDSITSVDVLAGRVRFSSASQGGKAMELTDGMSAKLLRGAIYPEPTTAATVNLAAWATHHFIYDNTPLEVVLDDLNAAFGHQVNCSVCNRKLSGEFDADSIEDAIILIETTLDIKLALL